VHAKVTSVHFCAAAIVLLGVRCWAGPAKHLLEASFNRAAPACRPQSSLSPCMLTLPHPLTAYTARSTSISFTTTITRCPRCRRSHNLVYCSSRGCASMRLATAL